MARIGTGVGRDAMVETLYEGLHIVVPYGSDGRTLHTCHKDSPQMIVGEKLFLVVTEVRGFGTTLLVVLPVVGGDAEAHRGNHRHSLMAAVEHQSGNLLDGELGGEVGSTLLSWEPPVLVGIERVITIQVLEGKAVHGEQLDSRLRGITERRATLLSDQHKRIHLPLRPFLTVASRQCHQCQHTYHKGTHPIHDLFHNCIVLEVNFVAKLRKKMFRSKFFLP